MTVRLWDVATGKTTSILDHNPPGARLQVHERAERLGAAEVVFSPDGKMLASAFGNRIRLWDLTTGKCTALLDEHKVFVQGVAFSPDGKTLASVGGEDGEDCADLEKIRLILSGQLRREHGKPLC